MKKVLLFAATLFTTTSASAQSAGYYEYIPYYNNDPFMFCTLGVPWDCWAPISPQLGTFTVTNPYCFNPTSAQQFARVCPKAFPQGMSGQQVDLANSEPAHDPVDASP